MIRANVAAPTVIEGRLASNLQKLKGGWQSGWQCVGLSFTLSAKNKLSATYTVEKQKNVCR